MINQQTLMQLLSAYGPQSSSLMASPLSAASPQTQPQPASLGGPNLGALLQGMSVAPRAGGMFAPMQPPQQPSTQGGMFGGINPMLMAALAKRFGGGAPGGGAALSPSYNFGLTSIAPSLFPEYTGAIGPGMTGSP